MSLAFRSGLRRGPARPVPWLPVLREGLCSLGRHAAAGRHGRVACTVPISNLSSGSPNTRLRVLTLLGRSHPLRSIPRCSVIAKCLLVSAVLGMAKKLLPTRSRALRSRERLCLSWPAGSSKVVITTQKGMRDWVAVGELWDLRSSSSFTESERLQPHGAPLTRGAACWHRGARSA